MTIYAAISSAGITIPAGALDRWFNYRTAGNAAAARREVVIYGDSTTFGSGGLYSWVQRLRDRSVAAGYADGGKGMFAGLEDQITYDSPEVNGVVSYTFVGASDTYDNLGGAYFYDNGATASRTLNLQFRSMCARIWYVKRPTAGDFTYSVDGGTAVTVHANQAGNPEVAFVWLSDLTAGVTHTLTITNATPGSGCWIALAPVNGTGIAYQKQAIGGMTFNIMFYAATGAAPYTQTSNGFRYQTELGLLGTAVASPAYTGAPVDTTHSGDGGQIKPVLAMTELGFNDLSSSSSTDLPAWTEYVKKFKGACVDAGIDGIVLAGQLPYNASWATYGADRYNAIKTTALSLGLGFVDLFYPIGGDALSYSGGATNPHLTKPQYQAQADFLWDNVLGITPTALPDTWTPVVAERWNGSSWSPVVAEEWNGTAWAPSVLERST